MAFAATMSTAPGLERPFSLGPVKAQTFTYTAVSGDTSGTITVPGMSTVKLIVLDGGLTYSAAPTYSGNAATLAFTDPAANRFGSGIAYGI
jgi:hypothetical protein